VWVAVARRRARARDQFTPPSNFAGATCIATKNCIAIGVISVDDAPTLVGFATLPDPNDLLPLGTFSIHTDGQLSLRDVNNHAYATIEVPAGIASLTVWGNDTNEPCELAIQVHATRQQGSG
jgi:hypothetical protein